ncbi:uncharacterized protein LY89DRAFT_688096 [Mollisia scopiformis]|uniref:Zn(2)-C6 fungal-type domain-containing protein n=1 Tax=Mollisia scopiformis TaxID=149040 RepID=A0A194WWK7_MOLSC|nr:uncharacterized protein LY89DRAFT_688096 [Mollisia scopiformis]KUJ12361.1 hypothetical protein LY89DRAFT_688096 [Mollisia scopiformis]
MTQDPKAGTKHRRTVISRSRNGCITCKHRKVRCDETTPSCKRCEKFGIKCDGYSKPCPKAPTTAGPKPLLPKGHFNSRTQPLSSALFRQLFRNEQEYRYFNIFCTQTAPRISGHFSTKLWQTLILQTSQAEALIRHAVIALGALINKPTSSSPSLSRRQFAFHQYHLSISLLRSQMLRPQPTHLRTTLLACLLFAIFETYNGYISSATTQIYSGVRLLSDWQSTQIHLTTKISSIKSPRPLVIEDELIHAFSELETEAMCRHDERSAELHEAYRYYGQMSIDTMPASFQDLKEARAYLILIGQRALHLTAWMKQKSNGALGLRSPEVFQMRKETEEAAMRMGMEYDRWERAFEKLWRGGVGVEKGVLALRIQLLTAYAWRNAMQVGEGVFYGDNTELLTEIVELAKRVRDNSEGEPDGGFGFEGGLITGLRTVGFVFRHRRLKREAMKLLLERPWKEGLWDSYVVGKALEWLIDLEDEGVDDDVEHVPEEKVLKDFTMSQDEAGRRTVLSGLQVVQGPDGEEMRRRELVILWLV